MKPLLLSLLLSASAVGAERVQVFTCTAYCPCPRCCGRWSGGPTASGKMPQAGRTVAGPRVLPFGTILYIPGVGRRVIEDRLSRRFDHRVDVFFRTHAEALRFGKRVLRVKVRVP